MAKLNACTCVCDLVYSFICRMTCVCNWSREDLLWPPCLCSRRVIGGPPLWVTMKNLTKGACVWATLTTALQAQVWRFSPKVSYSRRCILLLSKICIADKIIVGSYHGFLRIYNPRPVKTEQGWGGFRPEDVMCETSLNQPILQVLFLSPMLETLLAQLLCTFKLILYLFSRLNVVGLSQELMESILLFFIQENCLYTV